MPHEQLDLFSDHRILSTMRASLSDARYIMRRTEELIEQSRIILRELDVHGADDRRRV